MKKKGCDRDDAESLWAVRRADGMSPRIILDADVSGATREGVEGEERVQDNERK